MLNPRLPLKNESHLRKRRKNDVEQQSRRKRNASVSKAYVKVSESIIDRQKCGVLQTTKKTQLSLVL